jgi:hypothetical protein
MRIRKALLVLALLVLPTPSFAQPPAIRDALTASRALYPTPMAPAQVSEMLSRALVNHPGWALLRKDGGNNCPTPYQGIGVSCDWIIDVPSGWGYDVLYDQEGTGRLVWSDGVPNGAGISTVPAWIVGTPTPAPPSPAPPSQPPSPSPGLDLSGVVARLDRIESKVDGVYEQNERINCPKGGCVLPLSDQLAAIAGRQDAFAEQLKKHDDHEPAWVTRRLKDAKTYLVAGSGLLGWLLPKLLASQPQTQGAQ